MGKRECARMGRALAYYTAFSIAPLLVISLTITGFFYEGDSLTYIEQQISSLVGTNAAQTVTGAIGSIANRTGGGSPISPAL